MTTTHPTQAVPDQRHSRWTGEKTAWWIVFGVLDLSILLMLGLWN
ncbi:hypothetical protein [Microbacterium sp. MPKO10]|nr:hypothetical protein [Microbacterium sp. MPKO10]MCW4456859.1 hypothetical protein [Microbacterium sp. MPKO10]